MIGPAPVLLALAPELEGLGAYAWAFGQGLLVDLTPCVYPLIPITVAVFGATGVSRGRALFLAAAYVLGMATLYTSLGVVVALTGAAFGAWLANPWVVFPISGVLVALAASMFGAFELQLPTSLQGRLSSVGGAGPLGAFLMGLVSGFVSAPCTGPVLLSLLAYIAKGSAEGASPLHGGSLLFVYALGMGTLFFAVALGASLFRPGRWMEHVKSVFGLALLVMAGWFLRPLSRAFEGFVLHAEWGLHASGALLVVALVAGAVHLSFHDVLAVRLRKGVAVALATFAGITGLNALLYVPPMNWNLVATRAELAAIAREAAERSQPVLIDFAAAWCMPCKELELQTFHHPDVEPQLARRFTLVKLDVTDPTPEQNALKDLFDSATLPSVVVYPSGPGLADALAGTGSLPAPSARFRTFVTAEEFLRAIDGVR